MHVNILEESKDELPVWTVQSEKPLTMTQTVYGLEAGKTYRLQVGSEFFDNKVADTKGRISFPINLKTDLKKNIKIVAVGDAIIPD